MTDEVLARLARSTRYREVSPTMIARLAAEELPRSRNADEAVKRVKRRLHQAVGAFRGAADPDRLLAAVRAAWRGDATDPAFREACRAILATHASTRERVSALDGFFPPIWALTGGPPRRLLDLGCGLGPLMLPWMGLARDALYVAADIDGRALAVVEAFLQMVDQPHQIVVADLVDGAPPVAGDVALLLKMLPTLERQSPSVPPRLLSELRARHAVVSFPSRSLGLRAKGMERSYRAMMEDLGDELGLSSITQASVPGELVFVVRLDGG